MNSAAICYGIFIALLGYFLLLTAYYFFLALVGSAEHARRGLEKEAEDYETLYFSEFTQPVSIVIPARNEEVWIADTLKAALNLNYPTFEIIIVNDGSTDKTLEILNEILQLQPVELLYVKHYQDGKVNEILRSDRHPNVTVVNKQHGHKKAGAVNAGLNIAQYDYVCVVDADTILEQNALLITMAQIHKDPNHIVGIGSYFGLVNGFKIRDGKIIEHSFSYNPIIAYQNLEYIRSFIGNRIAWSKFNAMPNVAGGFGIWRKDVLYALGGYSPEFTCEDIELTFRAHDYLVKHKDKGYRIEMLPYYVGWTEGPSTIRSLVMQRNRWQRVVNETVWAYRHMLCNPRYKAFGFLTMPYYMFYEVGGIFVEAFSITVAIAAAITRSLDGVTFLALFLFMLLSQNLMSLFALLAFIQDQRLFRVRYIVYLALLSCVEFFWYTWVIFIAKVLGTIDFFRKVKVYDQYVRTKRTGG